MTGVVPQGTDKIPLIVLRPVVLMIKLAGLIDPTLDAIVNVPVTVEVTFIVKV